MTDRQAEILAAIIEAYAGTAEPVGSLALSRRFEYSPATIRSEMAALEAGGYITQPHTSAGRVPTDKGYRHYVNNLGAKPADYQSHEKKALRRHISNIDVAEEAIKQAAYFMARRTGNLAIATLPNRYLYKYGVRDMLSQPEFAGGEAWQRAATLVDELDSLLSEDFLARTGLAVLIGAENPIGKSSGLSFIVSRFRSPFSDQSYIGLVGPTRQDYPRVIGLVEYMGELLEEELAS